MPKARWVEAERSSQQRVRTEAGNPACSSDSDLWLRLIRIQSDCLQILGHSRPVGGHVGRATLGSDEVNVKLRASNQEGHPMILDVCWQSLPQVEVVFVDFLRAQNSPFDVEGIPAEHLPADAIEKKRSPFLQRPLRRANRELRISVSIVE